MELIELNTLITELCNFYERKEPKTATIELWFRLVKRIPSEPLKWITKHIEDNYESYPKNITSALWGSYTEWQQANPNKIVQETFFDCPDCSEGLIFARKTKNNISYKYVFRCIKCKQSKCRSYPESSAAELKDNGYNII